MISQSEISRVTRLQKAINEKKPSPPRYYSKDKNKKRSKQKGVFWRPEKEKWIVQVWDGAAKATKYLGVYIKEKDAIEVSKEWYRGGKVK